MKRLLLLSLTVIVFTACGDDTTTITKAQEEKNIFCVDALNKDTIKELFKEAKEITITSERESYCAYKFKVNKEQFYTHLSIGGIGFANLAMLEQLWHY